MIRYALLNENGKYLLSVSAEEDAIALCADMPENKQFTYIALSPHQTVEDDNK